MAIARLLKHILPSAMWKPSRAVATAVIAPIRFSVLSGHFRSSFAGKAVDRRGRPLPWYTYPAIDFLETVDVSGMRVLEFGGGQSTLWWARRGATVVTIEEDATWARDLERAAADLEVTVAHIACDRRSRDISRIQEFLAGQRPFDIIVIDGHLREECSVAAWSFLAPRGAMIIDNIEAPCYDFSELLQTCPSTIEFRGHAPAVHLPSVTALMFWGDCQLLQRTSDARPAHNRRPSSKREGSSPLAQKSRGVGVPR